MKLTKILRNDHLFKNIKTLYSLIYVLKLIYRGSGFESRLKTLILVTSCIRSIHWGRPLLKNLGDLERLYAWRIGNLPRWFPDYKINHLMKIYRKRIRYSAKVCITNLYPAEQKQTATKMSSRIQCQDEGTPFILQLLVQTRNMIVHVENISRMCHCKKSVFKHFCCTRGHSRF